LETGISAHNQEGQPANSEPMVGPKVSAVPIVRNAVPTVAAPLLPGAVVGFPVLRTMLPPRALLDAMLLRCAPCLLIAPLLGALLAIILVLSLLLLGVLLAIVLVLSLLLLGVLLPIVLVLPLLLLGVLLLVVLILPLLLLRMLLTIVLVLSLLLLGVLLPIALVWPLLWLRMLLTIALLPLLWLHMVLRLLPLLLGTLRLLLSMLLLWSMLCGLGFFMPALLLCRMILLFTLLLVL
jgi:hypothetical protein